LHLLPLRKRLLEEGLENQINRHKRCAQIIRDGVRKMGMKLLIDDPVASNTVTSVFLPENIQVDEFIEKMEVKGFTLYAGKGELKKNNMFQIANMGKVNEEMCGGLLKVIEETINELKG